MHTPNAEVPESSSAYLKVEFRDGDGKLALPASVNYEIKCLTTNKTILALTLFTPVQPRIIIHLTPTDNALQDVRNSRERRSVTVIADMGAAERLLDEFRYAVLNVRSHPA